LAVTGLSLDILGLPFLVGLLVLATHVPLGRIVLARGIVFIDLAIAQVAGLGVVAADLLGVMPQGWVVQVSAATAALAGAGILIWTDKRWPAQQEAIIGVVFVFAASAELILLGFDPHGSEHMKDLLVGQILWIAPGQLVPVLALYGVILAVLFATDLGRSRILFYGVFALAITASVQLVGVFLVFASLIVPALAAEMSHTSHPLVMAYAIGILGYVAGLVSSAILDFATGAAIVCALVLCAAATVGVAATLTKNPRRSSAG
jgi:zinc/manganese transport system permease protein